jgi:hypothetical protein
MKRLFVAIARFIAWVVALLRSVNIDQPRGVLLCIALQCLAIAALFFGSRPRVEIPAKPVTSSIPAQSLDPDVEMPLPDQEPQ